MESNSVPDGPSSGPPMQGRDRRKTSRYGMQFRVLVRTEGNVWAVGETGDVGAAGTFFFTDRPFVPNTTIEYVLTFPLELTKAAHLLRMRFLGTVLRCEPVPVSDGFFGVAVRNTAHRYLSPEESSSFDAMEQEFPALSNSGDSSATQ